jgi:hypothetical protein
MNPVLRVLQFPPEFPLHLQRIEIEIGYTAKAVADGFPPERTAELARVLDHLAGLVRAGFLCRPHGPDDSARLAARQSGPDRIVLGFAGRGVHVNLVVILLRLIHYYHHTPPSVLEGLKAAATDPAEVAEYFTPMNFPELVSGIAARLLVAVPGAPMRSAPDGSRALSQDMPLPGTGPLGSDAVTEAEVLRVTGAQAPDDELADHWLSVSQFDSFLPIGFEPEFAPGDEEFFPGPKGAGLEIEEISVEQVFLFEFLNVLSGGRIGQLAVAAP